MIRSLRFAPWRRDVRISSLRTVRSGRVSRVEAEVEGRTLWFESADVSLRPAPEGFGSALLPPALHRGRRLKIDGPVDATWYGNVERLLPIYRRWWEYPEKAPVVDAVVEGESPPTGTTALCFTGGVDSFHTLLECSEPIDRLVFVHGFDVPLADTVRADAFERSLREVAAAVGARAFVVRTNHRLHPASGRSILWEWVHGGALAGVGHLLSADVGTLVLSSTYTRRGARPWGSHFETDPLWSSSRLEVDHFGADHGRSAKLEAIASDPLVRRHLRVCWENRAPAGNCSRCGKCIVTRLALSELGELDPSETLDGEETLARDIDDLRCLRLYRGVVGRMVARGRLRPDVAAATERLLRRSRHAELPIRLYEAACRLFA